MIESFKHLLEEVLAFGLAEGTCVGNVIEELTSRDKLLSYVGDIFGFSVPSLFLGAWFVFIVLDDVWVR